MSQTLHTLFPQQMNFRYFSLSLSQQLRKIDILMIFFTKDIHTGNMRKTKLLLYKYLPTIMQSTCFNELNMTFSQEVERTELGHLFEHILLEYLCQFKLSQGHTQACFSGTTDWNWNIEPKGTFHITLPFKKSDNPILTLALQKSIDLLEKILGEQKVQCRESSKVSFTPLTSQTYLSLAE